MAFIVHVNNFLNTNGGHNRWFFERIINGISFQDLINEFRSVAYNQNNPTDCRSSDLFIAYLSYAEGLPFDAINNIYLSSHTGVIGQYMIGNTTKYITVFDIIEYYEGTWNRENFCLWLNA